MRPCSLTSIVAPILGGAATSTTIDESWLQGRTGFGGLGAAIAVSAAEAKLNPKIPLRSILVNFVGPTAPGEVETEASVMRQGKSVTTIEAKVRQSGQIVTAIQASFGENRETTAALKPKSMDLGTVPSKDKLQSMEFDPNSKFTPKFLQHFDIRWIAGYPFPTGGGDAYQFQSKRTAMWLKLRDDEAASKCPSARMMAIADMPPPVILTHYKSPVAVSSLSWSLEFYRTPDTLSGDEWFFLDYNLESAANGYSQQNGTIYNASGELVAYSRQCMVFFEPKL